MNSDPHKCHVNIDLNFLTNWTWHQNFQPRHLIIIYLHVFPNCICYNMSNATDVTRSITFRAYKFLELQVVDAIGKNPIVGQIAKPHFFL